MLRTNNIINIGTISSQDSDNGSECESDNDLFKRYFRKKVYIHPCDKKIWAELKTLVKNIIMI